VKILICAGGSGGHIYPALSVAQELKSLDPELQVIFLSTRKNIEEKIFRESGYPIVTADFISPYSKQGLRIVTFCLKNLFFLLKFIKETVRVFLLLGKFKPDVVIGFGGIGSVAAIFGARMFNIPSLIHEQNIVPGMANKLLSRIVTKTAIGFEQSRKYLTSKTIEYTGNPLRKDIAIIDKYHARYCLGLKNDKFTILVFGGSQGSVFINKTVIKAISECTHEQREALQIIHITGRGDTAEAALTYQRQGVQSKVFVYLDNMNEAYSASDVVISRAGAGTLNEISFFSKASILIPYPYARAHQMINAGLFQDQGAAALVKQDGKSAYHLRYLILRIMENHQIIDTMSSKSRSFYHENAALHLAKLCVKISKKQK